MVELRSKRCGLCGNVMGWLHTVCEVCDSDQLETIEEVIEEDDAFWTLSLLKEVIDSEEGLSFEDLVLKETQRWREMYQGHLLGVGALIMGPALVSTIEMTWQFLPEHGVMCSDLVRILSSFRPGLTEEAQISVAYYDSIEIEDET